jgi:predicted ATPase
VSGPSGRAADAMRITRMELRNWRNFQNANLALARRAFIVGPNASGKSNLLDAIRFLREVAAPGAGGLQAAVARRGGVASLRALSARRFPEIRLVVTIGSDSDPSTWRYELAFNSKGNRPAGIVQERAYAGERLVLDRPDKSDGGDSARLTQTALENVNTNQEFRRVATFLASIRYLHVVPHLIREPERVQAADDDPFGSDLIARMAEMSGKTRQRRLERIEQALRVAVPQLRDIRLESDTKGRWHIRANYQHWRPKGAWQSEESFSDGTLRLMGLLWALQEPGGPLLLEEPELSLSPAVICQLPRMFARVQRRGKQVIVTTHSGDLLQDEGIGLDEVHILEPAQEGTRVRAAGSIADARRLLEAGATMADVVVPRVGPQNAEQLSLLDL